jgi:hypothetical protein
MPDQPSEDRQPSSRDRDGRTAVEVIQQAPPESTIVMQLAGPEGVQVSEEDREATAAEMAAHHPHIGKFVVRPDYGPVSSARIADE